MAIICSFTFFEGYIIAFGHFDFSSEAKNRNQDIIFLLIFNFIFVNITVSICFMCMVFLIFLLPNALKIKSFLNVFLYICEVYFLSFF
jgi:hypothetical protein